MAEYKKYNVDDYINQNEIKAAGVGGAVGLAAIILGAALDYTPVSTGGAGMLVGACIGVGIAHFRAYSKMMADYLSNLEE